MSSVLALFGLLALVVAAYILVSFVREYGRPRDGGKGGADES